MRHLILSEIRRFRTLAILLALAYLVVLRFLSTTDLFALSPAMQAVGLLAHALAGLIFGLYQLGSHRRLNRWTFLIHRPLSPGRIFLALSGAAALLFALVCGLPLLLVTLFVDLGTAQWVDLRHYLLAPYLVGTALAFYWAGAFIVLSASRAAPLVLVLPVFFLNRLAPGLWIFVPQLVVLAWLAYLARASFKPDLTTHLRRPLPVTAGALPMQYAFLWLLVMAVMVTSSTVIAVREHGLKSYAAHSWEEYFPPGSVDAARYLRGADAFVHGLDGAPGAEAEHLRRQVELAAVYPIQGQGLSFPRRHQLAFMDRALSLFDEGRNLRWTFSHDQMLFQGRDAASGAPRGWLGPAGLSSAAEPPAAETPRFPAVPLIFGNRILLTAQELYEYQPRAESLVLRFVLPAGETFASPLNVHPEFATVLTDRRLLFFEPRELQRQAGLVEPAAELRLDGSLEDVVNLHVAELIDGYALSQVFGRKAERGFGEARQVISELRLDGGQVQVAQRPLTFAWSAPFRYKLFILSPVLQTLHDLTWATLRPTSPSRIPPARLWNRPLPGSALGLALAVALLSAFLTAWIARRRELPRKARHGWTVAALLLGLPCLLTFLVSTPRRALPIALRKTSSSANATRLGRAA